MVATVHLIERMGHVRLVDRAIDTAVVGDELQRTVRMANLVNVVRYRQRTLDRDDQ